MKILTSLILALSLFALPASAAHRYVDYHAIVGHAGCHAALTTSDEHSIFESFYAGGEGRHQLYIGTAEDGTPEAYALVVLLHEIRHCLQAQEGLFDLGLPSYVLELDADRYAADAACRLGLNGPQLLHDIFVYAQERFGYEGDSGHGTLDQRIGQGRLALSCSPAESPYANAVRLNALR